MRKHKVLLLTFAVIAIFLPVLGNRLAYAHSITLTDAVLANTNWTAAKISDTTPSGTASFTASQVATGGFPGTFRETNHFYGGPGGLGVGHVQHHGFVLSLADHGELLSLSFTFKARAFELGDSLAISYAPLLFQNGNYYVFPTGGNVVLNAWTTFSYNGLVPSDFTLVAGLGPANPDFSANGADITLGYFTGNDTGFSSSTSTRSGIDNFSVSIVFAESVPEPTTLLLLGTGLAGVATRMRKRHKGRDKEA